MAYTSLYCHYKVPVMTEDGSKIHELISVEAERYELCENHLRAFWGWILSCPLLEIQGRQPCFVYVGLSRKDTVNSVEMSILTTKKSQPEEKTDFAVCVPPLYGRLTRFSIVQFVELSRLLGARHFVFYDFGITPDVQLALKYYQSVGLASVIPWDLPVSWRAISYLGQSVALTDCLYRHMSAVNYLMFNDLYEFLVPRDISARSWHDLTTMLKPNICETHISKLIIYQLVTRSQPEEKTDFAVCVPPLYGRLTRFSIVQFVELSRLLGVRHFVFYDFGITPDVQLALKYYQSVGLASVIPWDLPVSWKAIWYLGQSVALTDCLYRHMSAVNYLMFNDLDEFLVPRDISARSWHDLTTMFKPNICGLSFRNAYFQINNLPACNQGNRCLTVLRATERHERFPNMGRNKVMVDPYKVFQRGIHHVGRPWPDVANYSVIEVPPVVAYVHHYRALQDDAMAERFTNDKFLVDTYSDPLIRMYSKGLVAIRAFSRNNRT
ncbi:beta-1,4-galactosyltransferase galt-1-like [Haliotis rufescens]|uniref:beta-1,4-galactosyltransferase galt-1-like n=1 Tax=Haliotis rufescens TaxID=6454 RepID=UPI00201E8EC0|nr:beta-1,4-galactosyltransferase galt-1-like [Haliotis rufescens]